MIKKKKMKTLNNHDHPTNFKSLFFKCNTVLLAACYQTYTSRIVEMSWNIMIYFCPMTLPCFCCLFIVCCFFSVWGTLLFYIYFLLSLFLLIFLVPLLSLSSFPFSHWESNPTPLYISPQKIKAIKLLLWQRQMSNMLHSDWILRTLWEKASAHTHTPTHRYTHIAGVEDILRRICRPIRYWQALSWSRLCVLNRLIACRSHWEQDEHSTPSKPGRVCVWSCNTGLVGPSLKTSIIIAPVLHLKFPFRA